MGNITRYHVVRKYRMDWYQVPGIVLANSQDAQVPLSKETLASFCRRGIYRAKIVLALCVLTGLV